MTTGRHCSSLELALRTGKGIKLSSRQGIDTELSHGLFTIPEFRVDVMSPELVTSSSLGGFELSPIFTPCLRSPASSKRVAGYFSDVWASDSHLIVVIFHGCHCLGLIRRAFNIRARPPMSTRIALEKYPPVHHPPNPLTGANRRCALSFVCHNFIGRFSCWLSLCPAAVAQFGLVASGGIR